MLNAVHPSKTRLRGDGGGFNPRNIEVLPLSGELEMIIGVFRDNSVGSRGRLDRPFQIIIPIGFQAWDFLNEVVYDALRSGVHEVIIDLAERSSRAVGDNSIRSSPPSAHRLAES